MRVLHVLHLLFSLCAVCPAHGGDWNYTLAPRHLAKGVAYEGSGAALRQLVRTLNEGQPVTVTALGGSVTRGHGGPPGSGDHTQGHPGSWSRLVFDYIAQRWPNKDNLYVNGAVPATGSQHFATCLKYHMHPRSNLVLLEFAVNDGGSGPSGSETVIRRIRAASTTRTGPAILFVNYHDGWFGANGAGHGDVWKPRFFDADHISEAVFNSVAQYYDVSSLSMRNALLVDDMRNVSGFNYATFANNWNHPNEIGHRMMADLVIYVLNRTATAMERGDVPHDDDLLPRATWLPPPLVEGNTAEQVTPTCHFGEDLHKLVTRSDGWVYVPDGEKPGFQANVSGSILELELGQVHHVVVLSHLRSWTPDMGGADISCVAGCTCEVTQVDARASLAAGRSRVMVQRLLHVEAANNCTMRIQNVVMPLREGEPPVNITEPAATFKVMGISVGGISGGGGFLGGEVPEHMVFGMTSHGGTNASRH